MVTPAPGERYTIRQKILKIFGAAFHIYDEHAQLVGYCRQKAFRLKEDLRFYTDETASRELFAMRARHIIDFSATYDITLPDGNVIGSLRRRGLGSLVRDAWQVFDHEGNPSATLHEDSVGMALARRLIPGAALFSPQRLHLETDNGVHVATFRTHFNPFVYRLGVSVHAQDERYDDLMILATGCLIAAIEGRQRRDSG